MGSEVSSTLCLITNVLPHQVISGTNDLVWSKMTRTKDAFSSGMANVVDTAKGVVQGGLGMTQSTLTGTKDAVSTGLTGAVNMAKGAIQTGMDTTKTVLTGTKDAVSTGLTGAVNAATGAVQTGLNTTPNVSAVTRNTVSSGMASAMGVANAAAQWGLDTSKAVLTGTKDAVSTGLTRVGNVARGGVQTDFRTIQNWLPGSQDAASGGLATSGAPDEGEQTILNPHEAQSCGVSRPPDTLRAHLDLAGKATTHTKGLVSAEVTFTQGAALGKEDDVGPGATTCGQEGARGFATLRDELEELGEIFQPMSAEEQGENRTGWSQLPGAWSSVQRMPLTPEGPLGLSDPVFPFSSAGCLPAPAEGVHGRPKQLLRASGRLGPQLPPAGFRARPEPPAARPVPGPGRAGPARGRLLAGKSPPFCRCLPQPHVGDSTDTY